MNEKNKSRARIAAGIGIILAILWLLRGRDDDDDGNGGIDGGRVLNLLADARGFSLDGGRTFVGDCNELDIPDGALIRADIANAPHEKMRQCIDYLVQRGIKVEIVRP